MGIPYAPVYPIPYLCRHLKIYINFFTLNHHRPFAEITCSQILFSQQMVGLIITIGASPQPHLGFTPAV